MVAVIALIKGAVMASLYKNNQIWYLSIYHQNKRITRSLKTKDIKVAKTIKPLVEADILNEHITGLKKSINITFGELVPKFLKANHNWSPSTYDLNQYILTSHLKGNPLPSNLHHVPLTLGILINVGNGD